MIETKTREFIVTDVKIAKHAVNKGPIVTVSASSGSALITFAETAEKAPRVMDVVRVTMEWGGGEGHAD